MVKNKKLNDFIEKKILMLLTLGIFLLTTLSIGSSLGGDLNKELTLLSAGICYFLILNLIEIKTKDLLVTIFNVLLMIFGLTFIVWVILNIIYPLRTGFDSLLFVFWVGFVILVGVKFFEK